MMIVSAGRSGSGEVMDGEEADSRRSNIEQLSYSYVFTLTSVTAFGPHSSGAYNKQHRSSISSIEAGNDLTSTVRSASWLKDVQDLKSSWHCGSHESISRLHDYSF